MSYRALAALWLAFPLAAASVQGLIRDSRGHPVPAATVWLQPGRPPLTTHTDSAGKYQFTGLDSGTYTLRVESRASGEAHFGPFVLASQEAKQVDLELTPAAFFDEPNFVVAGVTDTTNPGVHGSGMDRRSADSLAKAAAALGSARASDENPLAAVREYQRAAARDPSESNLFRWGAELLVHAAYEPAAQVFAKGHRLFPQSMRMLLGLAAAWYARGSYDVAARYFFQACDLDPPNPTPYAFLGQVQSSEITRSAGYLERMARFARLHPERAAANYDYAAALWKQHKDAARVQSLLEKAVHIDPHFAPAYLQLGILFEDQREYARATAALEKAVAASPDNAEAHYRLARLYRRAGDDRKAEKELQLSQALEKKPGAIERFVWRLRDP
jgi:tetratricopeptide (TPR) repeat protein